MQEGQHRQRTDKASSPPPGEAMVLLRWWSLLSEAEDEVLDPAPHRIGDPMTSAEGYRTVDWVEPYVTDADNQLASRKIADTLHAKSYQKEGSSLCFDARDIEDQRCISSFCDMTTGPLWMPLYTTADIERHVQRTIITPGFQKVTTEARSLTHFFTLWDPGSALFHLVALHRGSADDRNIIRRCLTEELSGALNRASCYRHGGESLAMRRAAAAATQTIFHLRAMLRINQILSPLSPLAKHRILRQRTCYVVPCYPRPSLLQKPSASLANGVSGHLGDVATQPKVALTPGSPAATSIVSSLSTLTQLATPSQLADDNLVSVVRRRPVAYPLRAPRLEPEQPQPTQPNSPTPPRPSSCSKQQREEKKAVAEAAAASPASDTPSRYRDAYQPAVFRLFECYAESPTRGGLPRSPPPVGTQGEFPPPPPRAPLPQSPDEGLAPTQSSSPKSSVSAVREHPRPFLLLPQQQQAAMGAREALHPTATRPADQLATPVVSEQHVVHGHGLRLPPPPSGPFRATRCFASPNFKITAASEGRPSANASHVACDDP